MVFFEIGIAVGRALGGLADLLKHAFFNMAKELAHDMLEMSSDTLNTVKADMDTADTPLQQTVKGISDKIGDPFENKFMVKLNELLGKHSEVPLQQIDDEINELWQEAKNHLLGAAVTSFAIEAGTFGQVEGGKNILGVHDVTSGLSSFANEVAMMRYRAVYLTPWQRYLNRNYPMVIPGASDIVRFGLREVYDPTRRVELLQELPSLEYFQQMLENGYNDYNASNYWAAHWTLPAVGQLNEMLHRRIIDEATWDRFVKYNDYDPTVRPWLKAISFRPYTRVDIRRIYDLGLVDRQGVKDNFLDLGYDEEHAEKMTIWTIAYVEATEASAQYKKGWITAEEFKERLIDAGVPKTNAEEYVRRHVKALTNETEAKARDLTRTDITSAVRKGILSIEEGRLRLQEIGYEPEEADLIVTTAVTEKISAEIEEDKRLSKTDIIRGVSLGNLTYEEGVTLLKQLGYSDDESRYILDIRVIAAEKAEQEEVRDLSRTDIINLWKKGLITENELRDRLIGMKYVPSDVDLIIEMYRT